MVLIVILLLIIVALAGFVAHLWLTLRDRDEQIHTLLEEVSRLSVMDRAKGDENYGLAMENEQLHREIGRHLFCLEMVLSQ